MNLKIFSILFCLFFLFMPMITHGAEKIPANRYEIRTSQDAPAILLDTVTGQTWILEIVFDGEKGVSVVNGWIPVLMKTEKKYDTDKTKNFWVYSAEDANFVRTQITGKDIILGIFSQVGWAPPTIKTSHK
ncbi:MAG: hypothetical protein IT362_05965 [Deltaproteobacteria bacterium]|nr:hypothetical protein [Deltaproteobacteria bacterium]